MATTNADGVALTEDDLRAIGFRPASLGGLRRGLVWCDTHCSRGHVSSAEWYIVLDRDGFKTKEIRRPKSLAEVVELCRLLGC